MPDETPSPVASPAPFNTDALAATVRAEVRGALTDLQIQAQRQQQAHAQAQAQQAASQQQWQDPVGAIVRPHIEPLARALSLQVQAANDKSDFYAEFSEAGPYRQQVESVFTQLMQRGQPMERKAIWHNYKGEHYEAFKQQDEAKRQAALEAASTRYASVGGPAAMRPEGQDLANFRSLPLDKMRDALQGHSF